MEVNNNETFEIGDFVKSKVSNSLSTIISV